MPAHSGDHDDPRVTLLEAQLARRSAALGHIQTVIKTFVTLSLTERATIGDTLLALICSFMEVEHGVMLILDPDDQLEVEAEYGVDAITESPALRSETAQGLWAWALDQCPGPARALGAEAVRQRWPEAPQAFSGGFGSVSIAIGDRPIGLIGVARKRSGAALDELDLELLETFAGLAASFISNGEAHQAQQMLLAELEWQAQSARDEAAEKQRTLRELDAQLALVERQRHEIRQLSTPILAVWSRVLVLPVIGAIDTRRSLDIMENLLGEIVRQQAKFAIIDITGVDHVDTETANYLIKLTRSAALLGTRCVLTGLRPAVAQTLTALGTDLSSVTTMADLRRGLDYCITQLSGP